MLHETIRNDYFCRNTALQHCCDIVSNGYNIVPILHKTDTQAIPRDNGSFPSRNVSQGLFQHSGLN